MVELTPAPKVVDARDVFTPDEMEARIAHYRARASARLPLFGGTVPVPTTKTNMVECWSCGERTVLNSNEMQQWHSRRSIGSNHWECYCRPCFEAFGWGDGALEK